MELTQELINEFIESVTAGKRNETPKAYRCKMNSLYKWIDNRPISQETITEWRLWLLNRKAKLHGKREVVGQLSPFTIRSIITTIKHFLRWGHERGYWDAIKLDNIHEPCPDPKAIRADTFKRMVLAAMKTGSEWEQVRNVALLYCLRDTGARAGELATVDISSINLAHDRGLMVARAKGGAMVNLYLSAMAAVAVGEWLKIRYLLEPVDYLLFTGAKKTGLTRAGIYHVMQAMARAGGVQYDRHNPHSFRHAFARDTLQAGADLTHVSQMLHHKGIMVTAKYYARWADSELRDAHNRYSPGKDLPDPRRRPTG